MTLESIERTLQKEMERAGDLYVNLVRLYKEVQEERQRREKVELRFVYKRRGRPPKFLRDLPTLEEQGLVPKAEETDSAQEAQQ